MLPFVSKCCTIHKSLPELSNTSPRYLNSDTHSKAQSPKVMYDPTFGLSGTAPEHSNLVLEALMDSSLSKQKAAKP